MSLSNEGVFGRILNSPYHITSLVRLFQISYSIASYFLQVSIQYSSMICETVLYMPIIFARPDSP